jgi:hypothetical protein
MPIEFCLPKSGKAVPSGPDWIHEVKYDGYRRVERHGDQVKLTSRGGLDWTRRFPWIVETARKIRKTQFVIDGAAVVLGVDGVSDFNALTATSPVDAALPPNEASTDSGILAGRATTLPVAPLDLEPRRSLWSGLSLHHIKPPPHGHRSTRCRQALTEIARTFGVSHTTISR